MKLCPGRVSDTHCKTAGVMPQCLKTSYSSSKSCSHALNNQYALVHLHAGSHKHMSMSRRRSPTLVVGWLYREDPRPKECLAPQRAAHNMTVQCPLDASLPAPRSSCTHIGYLAAELGVDSSFQQFVYSLPPPIPPPPPFLSSRCCFMGRDDSTHCGQSACTGIQHQLSAAC